MQAFRRVDAPMPSAPGHKQMPAVLLLMRIELTPYFVSPLRRHARPPMMTPTGAPRLAAKAHFLADSPKSRHQRRLAAFGPLRDAAPMAAPARQCHDLQRHEAIPYLITPPALIFHIPRFRACTMQIALASFLDARHAWHGRG